MSKSLEIMAAAVQQKPHSFQFIRKTTGLTMTDEEFRAMAQSDSTRFKLVRFLRGTTRDQDPPWPSRSRAAQRAGRRTMPPCPDLTAPPGPNRGSGDSWQ